jgi:hypothetical protein
MKQQITAKLTVEFDDKIMQADVDEAIVDALKHLRPMLLLVPAIKGKSSKGTQVQFKLKDIERA